MQTQLDREQHKLIIMDNVAKLAQILKEEDLKKTDGNGDTLLHYAVSYVSSRSVEYLISKGVCLNATNKQGDTPLHVALRRGCPCCAILLINKGADLFVSNAKGVTPWNMICSLKSLGKSTIYNLFSHRVGCEIKKQVLDNFLLKVEGVKSFLPSETKQSFLLKPVCVQKGQLPSYVQRKEECLVRA